MVNTVMSTCQLPDCNNPVALSSNGRTYLRYCSRKCQNTDTSRRGSEKRKQTCISRYGASTNLVTADTKEKSKQTSIAKYGTASPMQNKEVATRVLRTKEEKYGDPTFNNREKFMRTVDNWSDEKVAAVTEKRASTNLEKYGVAAAWASESVKEKIKCTNLTRYGFENPASSPVVQKKIADTMLSRFGSHINQRHYSDETRNILGDASVFTELVSGRSLNEVALRLGVDSTTVLYNAQKHSCVDLIVNKKSKWEAVTSEFLSENNISFVANTRKVIPPLELDFYLPDYNVAIELNGNYWHSEIAGKKDKNYHFNKWKMCQDRGVDLYSYFEDELINSINVIKSKIRYLVAGNTRVVGARKCSVGDVSYEQEKELLDTHHIQGSSTARNKTIGAYHNGQLVAVMGWQLRKQYLEITRFATDTKASYPGLFSKMMKHMNAELKYTGLIVSFSNNGHSNGGVYKAAGFTQAAVLGPAYWYTRDYIVRENRQGYMKSKIAKKFGIDMSNKTEWQAMQELGYDRVWDSGKIKWVLNV